MQFFVANSSKRLQNRISASFLAEMESTYVLCSLLFLTQACFLSARLHDKSIEEPVFEEKYIDQFIDHFNFKTQGNNKYKERYLITTQYTKTENPPIFFYTGNEGDILGFQKASGFITDLAPKFGALVVFAEHRYYGKSLPFGEDSFKDDNIGFLMMEQAMADYAYLMKYLKSKYCHGPCPIYAFGGSYGGMLAAYMRFKYPNFVDGSLAASAPLHWVSGFGDRHGFFASVTDQFRKSSPECVKRVKQGFTDTASLADQGKYSEITKQFHTCQKITRSNLDHLYGWVRNSFTNLAMMNYPYPSDLLAPLPGYPVNAACKEINDAPNAINGLALGAGIFYNGTEASSNSLACFDIEKEYIYCADPTGCGLGNDALAWDYQACTEIILPGGSTNVTDMFPPLPFTLKMRDEYCEKVWGVKPRNQWADINLWGQNFTSATNIIFSNGDLDPWSGGGIHRNLTSSLIALEVKDGAHHLDLRGSNPKDPQSVIQVRNQESAIINQWLKEFRARHGKVLIRADKLDKTIFHL